eukprot:CAMPEP_0174730232 /NCGR_PEP_ID=MMETSP1094-20130205/55193_1 /TAXON_ID=156173 /ORGANISM="Chrysochromulina brevifilum, Strain UTEX LB 985" /LENGTH=132 /DNA_ID=CAMNT_0015932457 /DNA_START=284 /DNA_END=683 /DNA_ORIENTATION=+
MPQANEGEGPNVVVKPWDRSSNSSQALALVSTCAQRQRLDAKRATCVPYTHDTPFDGEESRLLFERPALPLDTPPLLVSFVCMDRLGVLAKSIVPERRCACLATSREPPRLGRIEHVCEDPALLFEMEVDCA